MDGSRVCRFYRQHGNCRYGDNCKFSHDLGASSAWQYAERVWSHKQASTSSEGSEPEWTFRCCTYNCLADELAISHCGELYRAVPRWALAWPQRVLGLMQEIRHWDPDVLCLQEVDHLSDFVKELEPRGYRWRYVQRTGGRQDGCATFWRANRLKLVAEDALHMANLGLRDNVAQLVVLKPLTESGRGHGGKQTGKSDELALLVANTHVLFNPKRGDIKLAQLRTILLRMEAIAASRPGPTLRLFCGDFNSTPWSALYRFMSTGRLDLVQEDRRNMSGQTENRGWPPKWLRRGMLPSMPQRAPVQVAIHAHVPAFTALQTETDACVEPHHLVASQSSVSLETGGKLGDTPLGVLRNSVTLTAAALDSAMRAPLHPDSMHSSSWPCGLSLMQMRRCTPAPGQQLYRCVDAANGQPYMSPLPPLQGQAMPRQPFFYNAMVTEGGPSPRSSTPYRRRQSAWPPEELEMCGARLVPVGACQGLQTSSSNGASSRHDPPAGSASQSGQAIHTRLPDGIPDDASGPETALLPNGEPDEVCELARIPYADSSAEGRDLASAWDSARALSGEARGELSWVVEHPQALRSAYAEIGGAEPNYTSCHGRFIGTVDYLWYSGQAGSYVLEPLRVLDPPPLESLHCGLPSPEWASDHVSLVCDFNIRNNTLKRADTM